VGSVAFPSHVRLQRGLPIVENHGPIPHGRPSEVVLMRHGRPHAAFGRTKTTSGVCIETTSASIRKSRIRRNSFCQSTCLSTVQESETGVAHAGITGGLRKPK
jgi:hypothetical protein